MLIGMGTLRGCVGYDISEGWVAIATAATLLLLTALMPKASVRFGIKQELHHRAIEGRTKSMRARRMGSTRFLDTKRSCVSLSGMSGLTAYE